MGRVVDMGISKAGDSDFDSIQSFLQGDSFAEEGETGQVGHKPTVKFGAPGLLESYRESTDMISIDEAAARGFTGKKSLISSAHPAQFSGQTSHFASKPKFEDTTSMPGSDEGYTMTPDEIAREKSLHQAEMRGQGVGVKPIVTKNK